MKARDFTEVKARLNSVGWFIPPYVGVGFIDVVAKAIENKQGGFTQNDLEIVLSIVYDAERLASMVLYRYPQMPVISQFKETISEAIEAHFFGLHHVAVGGLVPVIEGAGRRLAKERGLQADGHIKDVFRSLGEYAKDDVVKRRIGAVDEILNMLDGFIHFIESYFYSDSQSYPLIDHTNRHGITHGAYADADYGKPINFFKTIAAVDFLTFISALSTQTMSGFAPDRTSESSSLAAYYLSIG